SSRPTCRNDDCRSSAPTANSRPARRSRRRWPSDVTSGNRRSPGTPPGSSPCTRGWHAAPPREPPSPRTDMTNHERQTVVIADYDYGDVDIEREIIEGAGLRLVAADCKTEDDVIAAARDADAVIAQYATVGANAVDAFTRCKVIARYGTGVDIVDVDAAT